MNVLTNLNIDCNTKYNSGVVSVQLFDRTKLGVLRHSQSNAGFFDNIINFSFNTLSSEDVISLPINNNAIFEQSANVENGIVYNQKLTVDVTGNNPQLRNTIQSILNCKKLALIFTVKDKNANGVQRRFFMGENGVEVDYSFNAEGINQLTFETLSTEPIKFISYNI